MILNKSFPELSLYCIGAIIIRVFKKYNNKCFYLSDLHDVIKKEKTYQEISLPDLILTLDWLFLEDVILKTENNKLRLKNVY